MVSREQRLGEGVRKKTDNPAEWCHNIKKTEEE